MATFQRARPKPQLTKPTEVVWDSFRRGVNKLLQDIELSKEEFKTGDNLILKGAGILTQRPGTANYFQVSNASPVIRRLKSYYKKDGTTKELLAFSDAGYFVKKSGASYSPIPGVSLPSGTNVTATQIYDNVYFSSISQSLLKYDGTSIYPYVGISKPTNVTASKISGTSGIFTWGWRVSAESAVGETLASTVVTMTGLPEDFTTTTYAIIGWNSVTNATGYAIYGRDVGNETFLTRVPNTTTQWIDDGNNIPSLFVFPPEADFTAGPKGKYIISFKEKLVIANLENNPSRIVFSGGGPNVDKFHWSKGGGYVDINKDDGEQITAIKEFEGKIIVWKERSTYQVTLTYNATYGIVEPIVQKITGGIGCVANDTVLQVENDIFFMGRRAGGSISLNALGYEPNFAQVLRTSETSARLRPEMETIATDRLSEMWAIYYGNRYWLFYPFGTSQIRVLIYDRERLAWTGPMTLPNNPTCGEIFYNTDGSENFVYGDRDDGFVTKIDSSYTNDKGVNFTWLFETKRERLKDSFTMKYIDSALVYLRSVVGTVTVNVFVEDQNGVTTSIATKDVIGTEAQTTAGWGSFRWGRKGFGKKQQASINSSSTADKRKHIPLYRSDINSVYISVSGTGSRADIMAIKLVMKLLQGIPVSWKSED